MSGQLELVLDERSHWRRIGQEFRALLRRVVDRVGLKEASFALGVDAATLAHALAGRKRHVPHAEWVPILLALAPDDEALEFLAALRGRDLVPARVMSAEEEVEAWRAAVATLPGDFRGVLEQRVRAHRRSGGRGPAGASGR